MKTMSHVAMLRASQIMSKCTSELHSKYISRVHAIFIIQNLKVSKKLYLSVFKPSTKMPFLNRITKFLL